MRKVIPVIAIVLILGLALCADREAFAQSHHLKKLDAIRSSMSELGTVMPDLIRKAKPRDIRTLERVFEINTYALTTIEAYFKMLKVAISSNEPINKDTVTVLNGWLEFINKYCKSDIEYFDEAISETKDEVIVSLIGKAKNNIKELSEITLAAIDENKTLLRY